MLSDNEAETLTDLSNLLREEITITPNYDNTHDLAAEWGLEENISPFLEVILPYQTRHYKHVIKS